MMPASLPCSSPQAARKSLTNRLGRIDRTCLNAVILVITQLYIRILPNGNKVAVELFLDKDEDKALFDSLEQDKANIEKELGALQWNRKDGAKIGTLTLVHPTLNYAKNEQWDAIFAWYREQTEKFIRFFQPRVRDKK